MGHPWHPECFRCTVCVKPLSPDNFKEHDGKPYCEKDYNNLFAPKCAGCKGPIVDVSALRIRFKVVSGQQSMSVLFEKKKKKCVVITGKQFLKLSSINQESITISLTSFFPFLTLFKLLLN